MEFDFNVVTRNGQNAVITLNDIFIDYRLMREQIPDSVCVAILKQIKNISGKKIFTSFGNCQIYKISNFILNNVQFQKEYITVTIPLVFSYSPYDVQEMLVNNADELFGLFDLFVTQYIKEKNRFYPEFATKYISKKLRDDAKRILIPNVYFDGYFPQLKRETDFTSNFDAKFPIDDKFVDEIMSNSEMNPDIEQILDIICDENFIPADVIQAGIDRSLNELKNREWICDVKMSDYVENNFRDQQILFTPNHPTPFLIFETTRRILKFLGIKSDSFVDQKSAFDNENQIYSLIGQDVPIYPAVKKYLDLNLCLEQYYANNRVWDFRAGFRDYMRQYILERWADKFSR